jgi:hypothetical protein
VQAPGKDVVLAHRSDLDHFSSLRLWSSAIALCCLPPSVAKPWCERFRRQDVFVVV